MNLFKLVGSIFVDNEEANKSISKTDEKAGKLGQVFQKGVQVAAAWGAAIVAAAAGAAIGFTKMAADAETSFAKVSTLLDTQNTDMSAYYDDILKASSATGVAMTDFSEAVYSAISASIDQADAVNFTTQAIKLAKGGFTEAATAVDVLTTAINAYGLSADQAEHLSNVLITTQNLGKTTVDELAASMGQVIPTASAYGVSMENLSAAYAELTKGGINTANSTTYLNQMFTELAKDGSTVSEILMNETGKSFSELMNDGESLGDVLDILYQSVDKDSVAFGNLWSSTTAGKGALALANAGAEEFNDTLDSMVHSAGAAESAFDTMENTFEAKTEKIKVQFQNIGITIGNSLLPIVTKVADYIEDKMPIIEDMADKFAPVLEDLFEGTIPPLLELCETIFPALIEAASTLIPILVQIIQKILPVAIEVLQMITPLVLKIISLFPGILDMLLPILDLLEPIIQLLEPIIDLITALLDPIMMLIEAALPPLVDLLTNIINDNLPFLQEAIQWLCDFLKEYVIPLIQALIEVVIVPGLQFLSSFTGETMNGIMQTISGVLKIISGIIEAVLKLIEGDFTGAGEAAKRILSGLKDFAIGTLRTLFANVIVAFQQSGDKIMTAVETVRTWLSDKVADIKDSVLGHFDKIKAGISDRLTNAVDVIRSIVDRMKSLFKFDFNIPQIKMPHFKVQPTGWQMGDLLKGTIPKLGIEWYAKAMDEGMIMDKPTIFGINGNQLMAGGEAGSETVVGTESLMNMIAESVNAGPLVAMMNTLLALLEQYLPVIAEGMHVEIYLDGDTLVAKLVPKIDQGLGKRKTMSERSVII